MTQSRWDEKLTYVSCEVVEKDGYKGLKGVCNSRHNESSADGTSRITNAEQVKCSGDTCSTPEDVTEP